MAYVGDLNEKICPICGKRFYPQDSGEWVYKRRRRDKRDHVLASYDYLCSWSCYKKHNMLFPEKPRKRGPKPNMATTR